MKNMKPETKKFHHPKTFSELSKVLDSKSVVLAGGTFLSSHLPKNISNIVDITNLRLNYIKKLKKGIAIGALATFDEVANFNMTGCLGRFLADTATQPLRNMITVGGNVMLPLRWCDTPLLFSVLDAKFVLKSQRQRTVSSDKFFSKLPKQLLKKDEILKEIIIPDLKKIKIARKKVVRAYDDIPALQIAVAAKLSRKKFEFIRIAYVGQKPLPIRLKKAEKFLLNKVPTEELINQAAETAAKEAGKINDIRFSSEYLNEMIKVYVKRLLKSIL